jgi:hypothetical protein
MDKADDWSICPTRSKDGVLRETKQLTANQIEQLDTCHRRGSNLRPSARKTEHLSDRSAKLNLIIMLTVFTTSVKR